MFYDSYKQKLITERCWILYDLITSTFTLKEDLNFSFFENIDLAVQTTLFNLEISPVDNNFILLIKEEYEIEQYDLVIRNYSYHFMDEKKKTILRADPLPHHQFDYREKKLSCYPHHLHDAKGRISSFSGDLADFIQRISSFLKL